MRILPTVVCGLLITWYIPVATPLSPPRPLRRVAVIGSGVAGLSLAHALANESLLAKNNKSDGFQVSIFDARSNLNTKAGAGIQLSGGLKVLGLINPLVQEAVFEAALPVKKIQSRAKPWNEKNEFDTLLQLDLRKVIEDLGAAEILVQNDRLMWASIMRGTLQQTLVDTLKLMMKEYEQVSKEGRI